MKVVYAFIGLLAISLLIVNPSDVFAINHTTYQWGADATTSATGATGARMKVTIKEGSSDHTFPNSNEDHNYHIDGLTTAGGADWHYLVGWQVGSGNPTTSHPWVEVWKNGVRQYNWQSPSLTYTDGTQRLFAFHKPSTTVYFYDGTSTSNLLAQYTTGNTDTYNAGNTWSMAEKICPSGCAASSIGDSPTVYWPIAIEYTTSSTYSTATWTAMSHANAYYQLLGPTESESTSYSTMCPPETMTGHNQDGSLATNTMNNLDASGVTCTSYTSDLW